MRPVPIQLATATTLPVFINPQIRLRRNAFFDRFLVDFDQFTAATHATTVAFGQIQFGSHETELLEFRQSWRNPNSANSPMGNRTPIEKETVGGNDCGLHLFTFCNEIGITDVGNPVGVAAGRAKPAREPAQAGVAENEAFRGF